MASLFDSRVYFKGFFYQHYKVLRPWLQKVVNLTTQKNLLPIMPLFNSGIDFGAFDPKIWVFRIRVLTLRL
jgi:hypothetical protein